MAYFPMFIDLAQKHILIVGGGAVAARRAGVLTEFGCEITVVSPDIGEEMGKLLEQKMVTWRKEEYKGLSEFLQTPPLFVLAAALPEVNRKVALDCRELGIPVNNASDKESCDFYFPGIAKERDCVIGITAGGSSHKLAAELSRLVRTFMKETWKA